MKEIVIYGASGFAKEVAHLIEDINAYNEEKWEIVGFIDDFKQSEDELINGYPLVKLENVITENNSLAIAIGVGSPKAKQIIRNKIKNFERLYFPNLFHPKVRISHTNNIGYGNIICEGAILTTNIKIDNFVTININATVGHDTEINDYTTLLPNSSISGNVRLNKGVDIGTNAAVIEKLEIGKNTIVGAGSVVIKDLPDDCTAVGIPAKPIKFHNNEKR